MITGSGFESSSLVKVAGSAARVLAASSTQLVVSTPPGAGVVSVTVTTGRATGRASTSYTYASPSGSSDFHFLADTDKWWIQLLDSDGNGSLDLVDALATADNNVGGKGFPDTNRAMDLLFSNVCQLYRNNPDGSLRAGGAKISFQRTDPQFGAAPTNPGDSQTPRSVLDHSVIGIRNVGQFGQGVLTSGTGGRASLETGENVTVENNAGDAPNGPLGTFADANVYWWNQSAIPQSRRTLLQLTEELGLVLAHEVGHSIGLDHVESSPAAPADTNVMSAVSTLDPDNVYAFDETTFSNLLTWLPGTNRCSHRAAWSPRRLLVEADAVVVGTPVRVQGGALELQVDQVLAGSAQPGFTRVAGFGETVVGPSAMAGTGSMLMFLTQGPSGLEAGLGQASGLSLAGHDPAEWTALIADYQALAQLSGSAYRERCAELLTGCLASQDARIRVDALVDLSTAPEVARGLTAAQAQQVV